MAVNRGKRWEWRSRCAIAAVMVAGAWAVAGAPVLPAWGESTVQVTAPFEPTEPGAGESGMGDLVADAVARAGASQVALVQGEALRAFGLPKGSAKVSQFLNALTDSGDRLVVLSVSGAVLKSALERSVSNLPQPSPGFLQVSGLSYTINNGAPVGARTSGIMVGGALLDPRATYTAAMPQSLAEGANGYFLVWRAAHGPSRDVTTAAGEAATLGAALRSYVESQRSVMPPLRRIHP